LKGIILHGGHGTRLRPLTHTGPKQLLPIANKPMSQYCLEAIKEAGIVDLAIIIGGLGSSKVREYYEDGKKFGVKISYIEQDYPKGIAHAVNLCKNFIGNEKFIVFLGDNIIKKNILEFKKQFEKSDSDATLLLCQVENPTQFGIAELGSDGNIKKIMEKPKDPPSNLAVTGIYFLTPKIFDVISRLKPSWRNELEITDALQMLLEEGGKISFEMITNYWKDTGTPEDIILANSEILSEMKPYFKGEKEQGTEIEGNVMVDEGTIIKNNVQLSGPVIIGKNCIIESGCNLGANTSIGDNCFLKECTIENSIIMNECQIESKIHIKNSIIAYNSKIKTNQGNEKVFLLGEGSKILL